MTRGSLCFGRERESGEEEDEEGEGEDEKSEKLRDERKKKGRYSGRQCETVRAADSASETIVCKWREEVKVARSTRIAEATKDAEGGDI